MYVGHFAIGLALKAHYPKIPALPLLLGVGFLDILDGLFILFGWDIVTPNLHAGPYLFFDLTFIDWDHSLVAALFWSAIWALFFIRDKKIASFAFIAAFSHFLADVPMHNSDLALFPFAERHLGFGLWGSLGTASWVLEGLFSFSLVIYAWMLAAKQEVRLLWPSCALLLLFLNLSPWLSPMKLVATLDEPMSHLMHGFLVTSGFLLPGAVLVWLTNQAFIKTSIRNHSGT